MEKIIRQEFHLRKKLPTKHRASKFKDVHFIFWPDNWNLHHDSAGSVNWLSAEMRTHLLYSPDFDLCDFLKALKLVLFYTC